jgi:hypothetical protein
MTETRIAKSDAEPAVECAFFTVSDSRFFLGAVALVNSIRLVGHSEPIFLIDAGLTSKQQDMLSSEVRLIGAPAGVPPMLMKMVGPLKHPAAVAILLDADSIVLCQLTELIAAARGGRLVAFSDNAPNRDRFFPDWERTLGLGPIRRQPYLASGHLVVPDSLNPRLLQPWGEGQTKIDLRRTLLGRGKLSDPFYFPDMDVFNAVAAAHLEPDEVIVLDHRLAPFPPFEGLRLIDPDRLLCSYSDGVRPFLLHHILAKPWLKATRTNIYSLLLPRLLLRPDVALTLDAEQVPLRLRVGRLANVDRRRANLQAMVYAEARSQLGRFGVRTRIARHRANRRNADHS